MSISSLRPNTVKVVRSAFRSHAECTCGWRTDRRWMAGFALFDAHEHAARTGHTLINPRTGELVVPYPIANAIRAHDEKFADMPRTSRAPMPTLDGHPDKTARSTQS